MWAEMTQLAQVAPVAQITNSFPGHLVSNVWIRF